VVRIRASVFRPAMLVIDMQNGFCQPGGSYEKYGGTIGADLELYRNIVPKIARLLDAARRLKMPVFYTQQVREESGIDLFTRLHRIVPERRAEFLRIPACVRGTWDSEILEELKPARGEHTVVKRRDSAFQDTELDLWLRSSYVDSVIITGVDTAICVENTLTDAFNIGYDVILVEDAVASSWPTIGRATIAKVAGSYGWVVKTEKLVRLLEDYRCGEGSFRLSSEYL
jgi:ureidoacrylate peracid hydrolase